MSIKELELLSKYIDIRIRGTLEVYARTREEAAEKMRDKIMDKILTKHPSFETTGLPAHWEKWLDSTTEKMLGIEVVEEDEDIDEEIDISWSNTRGGVLYKDGITAYKKKRKGGGE